MATAGVAELEAVDLAAAAEQYVTQGFVLVKNLITNDEAAAYRTESHRLLTALGGQDDPTWASARSVAGDQATRLMHLHDAQFYSAAFSRLLVDDRFTSVAAAVLGAPGNVQLHHTKLFVKPPENGSPFPLHQDHPFFPHTLHRVGAAIFHFDDVPEEKRLRPGHPPQPSPGAARARPERELSSARHPVRVGYPAAGRGR